MHPNSPSPHVLIIGGGLGGLTAALHLAERGVRITLIEAGSRLGGRLSGGDPVQFEQNGHTYSFPSEHGIHGVWGQYHNLRDMLTRHGIAPKYIPAREEAWIMRAQGRRLQWARGGSALRRSWIPAPFHYLALFLRPRFLQILTLRDLASMFRVLGSLIFASAYDPAREASGLSKFNKLTLADYFRGWSPTLQALFTGLARNFTSSAPDTVPQTGFIAFLRFYTLLRRDSWAFSYFDSDSDTALIQPIRDRIMHLSPDSEIHLNTRATGIDRHGAVTTMQNDTTQTIHADHVIFALDVHAMRTLLQNSPDPGSVEHIQWPQAVPTVILRFWFNTQPRGGIGKPEAGIFSGDFTLDNFFWLHRFQRVFQQWSAETGGSAVECHIYGPPGLFTEPDAALITRGLNDLYRTWPDLRGKLITQSIRRNPPTHSLFPAQNEPNQLSVDLKALSFLAETGRSRFSACGDWINYPHAALYMERATVTGIAAANRALEQFGLPAQPIRAVDPPEPLARAIEWSLRGLRRLIRRLRRGSIT